MAQPESSLYQEEYSRWLVQSYVPCKRPDVASLLCRVWPALHHLQFDASRYPAFHLRVKLIPQPIARKTDRRQLEIGADLFCWLHQVSHDAQRAFSLELFSFKEALQIHGTVILAENAPEFEGYKGIG